MIMKVETHTEKKINKKMQS